MRREYISFICSTPRRNAPPKHPTLAFIKTATSQCRKFPLFFLSHFATVAPFEPEDAKNTSVWLKQDSTYIHAMILIMGLVVGHVFDAHKSRAGCLWNCILKLKSEAKISATARWMAVKWDVCSTVRQSADLSANIFAQTQGCSNIWTHHQHCHFWPRTVSAEHFRPEWNIPAESRLTSLCFETQASLMLTKKLIYNWDLTHGC